MGEEHDIGWTGALDFEMLNLIGDLKYLGLRKQDGSIDDTISTDVTINYNYRLVKGKYKEG